MTLRREPPGRPDFGRADPTAVVAAFLSAMQKAGIVPVDPIDSFLLKDQVFYFRAQGDRPYERKGWAVLHLSGRPAGAFGHFRANLHQKWYFKEGPRLPPEVLHRLTNESRAVQVRRQEELIARQRLAAARCQERWHRAAAADPRHPYLTTKGISGEGVRQTGELLLVPMLDPAGRLWNLQTISADGSKRFAKGARQKGLHLMLGEVTRHLAIAEGYGTAAVVRRATGLPCLVAFSASNLTEAAKAARTLFRDAEIVIAADDDAHLVNHPQIRRNLGLEAAHAAAKAIGARVAIPRVIRDD